MHAGPSTSANSGAAADSRGRDRRAGAVGELLGGQRVIERRRVEADALDGVADDLLGEQLDPPVVMVHRAGLAPVRR
jgi:hypothetical protein